MCCLAREEGLPRRFPAVLLAGRHLLWAILDLVFGRCHGPCGGVVFESDAILTAHALNAG